MIGSLFTVECPPATHCIGVGTGQSPNAPVIAATDVMPEHLRLAVLASWCSLRRGEVRGLQRRDFDLQRQIVTIDRAVVRSSRGIGIGPPKTTAGLRSVSIPANIVPDVRSHLECHVGPESDALVFTGEKGVIVRENTFHDSWDQARRAIGRPELRFHDLCHSGATWAAASGASTKALMCRLGHASPAAALWYQHATDDQDRAIAYALEVLASQSAAPSTVSASSLPA